MRTVLKAFDNIVCLASFKQPIRNTPKDNETLLFLFRTNKQFTIVISITANCQKVFEHNLTLRIALTGSCEKTLKVFELCTLKP